MAITKEIRDICKKRLHQTTCLHDNQDIHGIIVLTKSAGDETIVVGIYN
jgi:hypothetical protein